MDSRLAAEGKTTARRWRKAVRRLLLAISLLLLAALIVVAVRHAWIRHIERGEDRKQKLQEADILLRLYADENKDEAYPPMASGDAAFRLDLEALAPYFRPEDRDLQAFLAGETGIDICYLGHIVASDWAAQTLLDEYVDKGIEQVRNSNIKLDHAFFHGTSIHPTRTIWRFSESEELTDELVMWNSGTPTSGPDVIPVLWELPNDSDPRTRHGGWVLYMDWRVVWKPYPGDFPMNEEFVRRIRELKSMPPADWKSLANESPESRRIREAIRPLLETRFLYGDPVLLSCAIAHFDRQPTVEVDGLRGCRVVLRNQWLNWFSMDPDKLDPETLTELVVFPSNGDFPAGFEQRIPWTRQQKGEQACAVDLGRGAGYRWFGRAAPPWLGFVQERLDLTGGSDYVDELVAWLGKNEVHETRRLAIGASARCGAAAYPFLEQAVENPELFPGKERTRTDDLAEALEIMPDSHAGELLATMFSSGNESARIDAERALIRRPRPEGKAAYLDMLRRREYCDDRERPMLNFQRLVRAAAQYGGPEARPLLQELCAHPNECVASQARLALEGWPIPEGLVGVIGVPGETGPIDESALRDGAPRFTSCRVGSLGEGAYLDFDTGRVFEVPMTVTVGEDPAVTRAWLRKNGIDAKVEFVPERHDMDLTLFDFRVLSSDDHGWESSASEVLASLQRAQKAPSDIHEEVELPNPLVRLFETYEGASGVFRAEFYVEGPAPKKGPEYFIRLSYKLVDDGSGKLRGVPLEAATNAPYEAPVPQNQISATRQAILAYARAHEKQWPDSLEDVLAGGYLKVSDPDIFLAQFEYIKPTISLEEVESWNMSD